MEEEKQNENAYIVLSIEEAQIFYGIQCSEPFFIDAKLANVGDMLRNARERKNITIENLALKLNLNAEIIRKLEANKFDNLSGNTYIKGYLALITKVLGSTPDSIIKAYDAQISNLERNGIKRIKPEFTDSLNVGLRHIFVILLLGLITLASIYDFTYSGKIDSQEIIAGDALENKKTNKTFFLNNNGKPNEMQTKTISIRVVSKTDLFVKDAFGKVLYEGIALPNQLLELVGATPYSLKIGDSDAVMIEFQGRILNLKEHQSQGTKAEFIFGN